MTADEFEAAYADRSGVSVRQLHAWGRHAERCDCDDESCEGWAMGHQWEDAIVEDRLRDARTLPARDEHNPGTEH